MALSIDVSIVPWSHRGSFLSWSTEGWQTVGRLTSGNDVYLITQCRQWTLPLFALRALPNGETVRAAFRIS